MNERTETLRRLSLEAEPAVSCERAELLTDFYRTELGPHSVPMMRALAFAICASGRRSSWGTASSSWASAGRGRRQFRPIPS